jgi:hypothetical protein
VAALLAQGECADILLSAKASRHIPSGIMQAICQNLASGVERQR